MRFRFLLHVALTAQLPAELFSSASCLSLAPRGCSPLLPSPKPHGPGPCLALTRSCSPPGPALWICKLRPPWGPDPWLSWPEEGPELGSDFSLLTASPEAWPLLGGRWEPLGLSGGAGARAASWGNSLISVPFRSLRFLGGQDWAALSPRAKCRRLGRAAAPSTRLGPPGEAAG